MRNRVPLAAASALVLLAVAASSASATTFSGAYSVDLHTTDPGLKVFATPGSGPLAITLANGGSTVIDLFTLYTDESSVNNGEDTKPYPISVAFNFTSPVGAGAVGGTTVGEFTGFFDLFQDGAVNWSGPTDIHFANGQVLHVSLNDATFNASFLALHPGVTKGADIDATFSLTAGAGVPEPASWALMIGGFGMAGAVLRRRAAVAA